MSSELDEHSEDEQATGTNVADALRSYIHRIDSTQPEQVLASIMAYAEKGDAAQELDIEIDTAGMVASDAQQDLEGEVPVDVSDLFVASAPVDRNLASDAAHLRPTDMVVQDVLAMLESLDAETMFSPVHSNDVSALSALQPPEEPTFPTTGPALLSLLDQPMSPPVQTMTLPFDVVVREPAGLPANENADLPVPIPLPPAVAKSAPMLPFPVPSLPAFEARAVTPGGKEAASARPSKKDAPVASSPRTARRPVASRQFNDARSFRASEAGRIWHERHFNAVRQRVVKGRAEGKKASREYLLAHEDRRPPNVNMAVALSVVLSYVGDVAHGVESLQEFVRKIQLASAYGPHSATPDQEKFNAAKQKALDELSAQLQQVDSHICELFLRDLSSVLGAGIARSAAIP